MNQAITGKIRCPPGLAVAASQKSGRARDVEGGAGPVGPPRLLAAVR